MRRPTTIVRAGAGGAGVELFWFTASLPARGRLPFRIQCWRLGP